METESVVLKKKTPENQIIALVTRIELLEREVDAQKKLVGILMELVGNSLEHGDRSP